MAYNREIHHRRTIRLKNYDYSRAASYFITICVHNRRQMFGKIVNDQMVLNEMGEIAFHQWQTLPERFANILLGVFQIMPDHMHGIISLTDSVAATLAVAPNADNAVTLADDCTAKGAGASPAPANDAMTNAITNRPTVGAIVGAYKSLTAMGCLEIFKQRNPNKIMGKLWQRDYYEHIIRDARSYQRISCYIKNNPRERVR